MQRVIEDTRRNFPTARIIDVKTSYIVVDYYTADGKYYIVMVSDEYGRGVSIRVRSKNNEGWQYHKLVTTNYNEDASILRKYPPQ